MRVLIFLLTLLLAWPVFAEGLAVRRVIRAGSVVNASDLMKVRPVPGGLTIPSEVVGQQARVTLYAGRALRSSDLTAPALVDRNQLVKLIYRSEGLWLVTEGRALARGAAGEVIRVMNLHSRIAVIGVVQPDGSVLARGR